MGGTGNSRVIKAIVECFELLQSRTRLTVYPPLLGWRQHNRLSLCVPFNVAVQHLDRVIWEVDSNTEKLSTWKLLCIGGPALVTTNIAVELSISNVRAVIKEVVLHPFDELGWYQVTHQPIVTLSRPPICGWIELVDNFGNANKDDSDIGQNPSLFSFPSFHEERHNWFPVAPIQQDIALEKPTNKFSRTQIILSLGTHFMHKSESSIHI